VSDPADAENPGNGRHAARPRSEAVAQARSRQRFSGSDHPPVAEDYGGSPSSYRSSGYDGGVPYGGSAYESDSGYRTSASDGTSSYGGSFTGGSEYVNGASTYADPGQGDQNGTSSYSNGVAPYPSGTSSYANGAPTYPNGRAGSDGQGYANGTYPYGPGSGGPEPGRGYDAGPGYDVGGYAASGSYDVPGGYAAVSGTASNGAASWSPYDGDPPAPAAPWSPYDGPPPPAPEVRVPHPPVGSPYSPPTGTYASPEGGAGARYDASPSAAGAAAAPAARQEPYPPTADRTDPRYGTPGSPLGPPTPIRGPVGAPAPGAPAPEPVPRHSSAAMSYRPLPGTLPNDDLDDEWPDEEDAGTRRLTLRRTQPPPRTGQFPVAAGGWRDEGPESSPGPDDESLFGSPGGSAGRPGYGSGSASGGLSGAGPVGGPVRGGRLVGADGAGAGAAGAAGWGGRSGGGSGDGPGDFLGSGSGSGSGSGRGGWARGIRRRPPKNQTPLGQAISAVSEVVVVVALALTLALVIKTFLVQAFFIPSESMEDTLLTGDRVLVSKLTPGVFDLHRGDIVVFKDPGGWLTPTAPVDQGPLRNGVRDVLTFVGLLPQDSGEHLIKRVIGLPGDRVSCAGPGQPVKVNGVAISEPYVFPGNNPSDKVFDVTVPAGHLWVLGDHREVSEDSRFHPTLNNGMVPIKDVVGKAFVIVWPLSRASTLGIPDTVFSQVPQPASVPASTGS
jgi:signal peptidase I